jgi:hypothetical protein
VAYPASLDDLTNPLASDPRVGHAALHGSVNDAIEALEAKVGTGAFTPTFGTMLFSEEDGVSYWADPTAVIAYYGPFRKWSVTLSSADILDLHNTPIELVAAPGAGKWVHVHAKGEHLTFGTTAYVIVENAPSLYYDSESGLLIDGIQTVASAEDTIDARASAAVQAAASSIVNKAVVVALPGAALTDGDGTLTVTVWYSIEDVP